MVSLPWIPSELCGGNSKTFLELPPGCRAFGPGVSLRVIDRWLTLLNSKGNNLTFILILGGSRTAEVQGISAAGSTSESRRYTAIADAEFLLNGPTISRRCKLPPLPAGISPALISYVASQRIGLEPLIITAGLLKQPSFPHICIELPSLGPASCLSKGEAMDLKRVKTLWQRGLAMGRKSSRPLLLAECVPGGTTTAQAILTGLGLNISECISGSMLNPPIALKKRLIEKGLNAANLDLKASPQQLVAAVGDPFQPVAVGLLMGAREVGQPVLLGGGSQMLAVLALALASIDSSMRSEFVEGIAIATTSWLVEEKISRNISGTLINLMEQVGLHFSVELLGFASGLRFDNSSHKALRDYEVGYVKEGVGAGALSFLAQINGASKKELVDDCEKAIDELIGRVA